MRVRALAAGKRGSTRVRALMARAVTEFFDDDCPLTAAGISYYALFSLFPLAILSVGVFGLVIGTESAREQVVDTLLKNLPLQPGEGRRQLGQILEDVTSGGVTFSVVGVAGLTFAASGLMGAVRRGVNSAWDSETGRPLLVGKLLDIGLVFGVGLVIALSLILTVLVQLAASVAGVLSVFIELIPLTLSFLVSVFLYRVLPNPHSTFRDVWPGAVMAALGYEAARRGFTVYLDNFANYSAVYGSLGAVIAFVFFVFVAANMFLFAAELASEWPAVRDAPLETLTDEDRETIWRRGERLLRRLVLRER